MWVHLVVTHGSRGHYAEINPLVQINIEQTIGVDMGIDEWGKPVIVTIRQSSCPYRFRQNRLHHACVHIDKRGLK